MRNKQGTLKSVRICLDTPLACLQLTASRDTHTDSIMTVQLPHKQDEESALRQGDQPLCLQHVQAVERSGAQRERKLCAFVYRVITDYTQWLLTKVT